MFCPTTFNLRLKIRVYPVRLKQEFMVATVIQGEFEKTLVPGIHLRMTWFDFFNDQ